MVIIDGASGLFMAKRPPSVFVHSGPVRKVDIGTALLGRWSASEGGSGQEKTP
jgi:hypothetical protein